MTDNDEPKNEAKEAPPSLDLIFQEVKDRLDKQFEQIEQITSRAAFVMGFASLILGSLITIRKMMGQLSIIEIHLLGGVVVIYALVICFGYLSYRPRPYRRDPDPKALRTGYLDKPAHRTQRQVLNNFIESFEHNEAEIDKRLINLRNAMIVIVLLVVYLLTLLLFITPEKGL